MASAGICTHQDRGGLGLDMGDGAAPLRKLTPVENEASDLESMILRKVGNLAL